MWKGGGRGGVWKGKGVGVRCVEGRRGGISEVWKGGGRGGVWKGKGVGVRCVEGRRGGSVGVEGRYVVSSYDEVVCSDCSVQNKSKQNWKTPHVEQYCGKLSCTASR